MKRTRVCSISKQLGLDGSSCEQLCALLGELHIGADIVQPEPRKPENFLGSNAFRLARKSARGSSDA
jgi:hypothetical protein